MKPNLSVASLLTKIAKFDFKIRSLEDERSEVQEELAGVVAGIYNETVDSHLDLVESSDLEFGLSDCEKSPTVMCVYDDINDPAHDSCLFCGQPRERK